MEWSDIDLLRAVRASSLSVVIERQLLLSPRETSLISSEYGHAASLLTMYFRFQSISQTVSWKPSSHHALARRVTYIGSRTVS